VQLIVNDKQREAPEGTTVAGLIELVGLSGSPCAAEVNKELVPKREHAERVLSEGDRVELVTLVGGG
jgi:thiamine biosynthesis protein ThiS